MKPDKEQLTALLLRALGSSLGLSIKTNDANRLRADLYKVRKTDPDFEPLSLVIHSPERLLIVKKEATDAPPES